MKNQRQLLVGIGMLIGAIAVIVAFIAQHAKPGMLKLNSDERIGVLILASTIAENGLRSPQFMENKYIDNLHSIAKKHSPNTDWFAKSTGEFRMERGETENKEVYTISDGLHCAEFAFQEKEKEYFLLNYSFDRKKCDGGVIWSVTEEEYLKYKKQM